MSQLDQETLQLIAEFRTPITFSEREIKQIVDLMNKLNIETLNSKHLAELIRERGGDPKGLGTLNLLAKLYSSEFPDEPIEAIVTPLRALYNLRIAYLHLQSDETRDERIRASASFLRIEDGQIDFRIIYPVLLEKITECYEELTKLSVSGAQSP